MGKIPVEQDGAIAIPVQERDRRQVSYCGFWTGWRTVWCWWLGTEDSELEQNHTATVVVLSQRVYYEHPSERSTAFTCGHSNCSH